MDKKRLQSRVTCDNMKQKLLIKKGAEHFCGRTSIHGVNMLQFPGLHPIERFLWLAMVIAAIAGSLSLTLTNLNRFLANPTVVSIQKDFRNWMNHLPAATGCLNEKLSLENAEKYIKSQWNVEPSDEQFAYYFDFVKTVSNTTYYNLEDLRRFQDDKTLKDVDMVKLVTEVHPDLSGTLVTFERKHELNWKLILTELGVCITFNSKFSKLLEIRKGGVVNNSEPEDNYILKCHYLNRLCYARYDSDPNYPLKYHIHSYLDIAHINSNQFHQANISDEVEINYKMTETDASPDIRYLSPTQRRCRFDDEPLTDNVPYYSTTICFVMCRYEMALKLCGCKPFFYHFLDGKTCDIKGMLCLSRHADLITQPPLKVGCKCPQPCNLISYLPQIPKYTRWDQGGFLDQRITFRWGLIHPTTKYRRDILFGFGDLVVSLGGTFNLFLGISFITLIETAYLIVEGIFKAKRSEQRSTIIEVAPIEGIKHI